MLIYKIKLIRNQQIFVSGEELIDKIKMIDMDRQKENDRKLIKS